jgi:MFS family permease
MAHFVTQAGLGQAVAPLHIIGDHFKATNPGQLAWYVASYSLTVGTFILIAGRLGDVYGHRKIFIIGFGWFGIWSLLAGYSFYGTQPQFILCRAMQGIGPALLMPNGLAILGRSYPPGHRKHIVFSIFGAVAPAGFVFGAIFSSLLAEVRWPWAFWAMSIVCAVLAFLSFFVIPAPPPALPLGCVETGLEKLRRLDLAGSFLGICGLVLINFAFNQGPVVGWNTQYVYFSLIIGVILLVAFYFVERQTMHPLVPFEVLGGETAYVLLCVGVGWSSFGIWVFYTWQFLELIRNEAPIVAAAQFVPCAFSGLAAAMTTGFLMSKLSPAYIMVMAMFAFTIGETLIATAPVDQIYWAQTFLSTLIMPWGMVSFFFTFFGKL